MHDNLLQYAVKHQLKIEAPLGFGIHGSVFLVSGRKRGVTAVKQVLEVEPFVREFEVYARLDEFGVSEIHGFNVPQLLYVDEDLRVLEMSVVVRPFILDFAGAYLDVKPAFTPTFGRNGKRSAGKNMASDGRLFGRFWMHLKRWIFTSSMSIPVTSLFAIRLLLRASADRSLNFCPPKCWDGWRGQIHRLRDLGNGYVYLGLPVGCGKGLRLFEVVTDAEFAKYKDADACFVLRNIQRRRWDGQWKKTNNAVPIGSSAAGGEIQFAAADG